MIEETDLDTNDKQKLNKDILMKTELKLDEKIALELHPHWFTMIVPFLLTLVGSIAGIVVMATGIVLGIILPIIFVLYFLFKTLQRNNNIWVVTNLRVIDEEGVLSNKSKESPLDKINNITYFQTFWGKVFGFGNVQIQTAAEIGSTTYRMVSSPKKLKDTITLKQEEYKQYQIDKQAQGLANAMVKGQAKVDVAAELEKLFELKEKGILTEDEYQARKVKLLNS